MQTCSSYVKRPNFAGIVAISLVNALQERNAALQKEIERLQERLDIETRFRTDTQVRHFKSWIRRHPQAQDTDFFKRFLADRRMPQHASRSMYEAFMRLYRYSDEDIYLFEEVWKDMLFIQS